MLEYRFCTYLQFATFLKKKSIYLIWSYSSGLGKYIKENKIIKKQEGKFIKSSLTDSKGR